MNLGYNIQQVKHIFHYLYALLKCFLGSRNGLVISERVFMWRLYSDLVNMLGCTLSHELSICPCWIPWWFNKPWWFCSRCLFPPDFGLVNLLNFCLVIHVLQIFSFIYEFLFKNHHIRFSFLISIQYNTMSLTSDDLGVGKLSLYFKTDNTKLFKYI